MKLAIVHCNMESGTAIAVSRFLEHLLLWTPNPVHEPSFTQICYYFIFRGRRRMCANLATGVIS